MVDTNRLTKDNRAAMLGTQQPTPLPSSSKSAFIPAQKPDDALVKPPTPPTPSTALVTPPGSSSTPAKAATTAPVSTKVPEQYTASSYKELIPEIERRLAEYKPMSKEDLEKLRRRQKAESIVSGISDAARAVSNLFYATQYAPSMYNHQESMSAKAKERFEKEKAEREANDDRYMQYALTLGKLRDADKERGMQVWNTEQTLARQDRAYNDARKDREDDVAFRDRDYDERVRQWQDSFDRQDEWHKEEGERWETQFNEGVRQFNVSAGNERARLGMEAQRLAHSLKEGQMTFNLGSGNGNVTLPVDKLNAQTVSRIYSTLPEDVRSKVQGEPIAQNGFVVGYKPPTTEAMLIAIGANVDISLATQNAIKQVAGLETGKKLAGY